MNPDGGVRPDATAEISALIETLHQTGRRLEELTAGEVDAVADRDGHLFVLQRAQGQLRDMEASKQAAILNALPAHVALLDAQGLIVSTNEAWQNFAGANALLAPGHAVGLNYLEVCDQARGDAAAEARPAAAGIRSVLAGTTRTFSLEYPCHSPTEQRWFLMTVAPMLRDHAGGAVVMHVNITAQRLAEQGRRDSDLLFRQMSESIDEVFFLVEADTSRVLYVSPAYEEISGRTRKSLYENPEAWVQSVHPEDRAAAYETFQAGLKTGKLEYEYRTVRPDGAVRLMEVRGSPVRDAEGKVTRMAGIIADITERRQATDALRQSENLKGAILESSLDCIVALDGEGRIVEFNAAAEKTLGLPRAQALGRLMVDLFVPARFRDAHRKDFAHYLATGQGWLVGTRRELVALRADGSEFPIEIAVTAVPGLDKPMFTGFIRDITERKQAERDLYESQLRFSDMLDTVELISLMLDGSAGITYCNDYFLRLTGWSREEVIGRNWFDTFMPPALGDMKPVFAALLANQPDARHRDNEIFTRSGERRLIRWSNTVLRSGTGDVIGSASIGEDITERKAAETVLAKRAAELERFHRLSVGRELQMIELKKQVNELAKLAGQAPPHALAFLDPAAAALPRA